MTLSEAINHPVPAKIAFEIMRGYIIKSRHPLFELVALPDKPLSCGNVDRAMNAPRVLAIDQLIVDTIV